MWLNKLYGEWKGVKHYQPMTISLEEDSSDKEDTDCGTNTEVETNKVVKTTKVSFDVEEDISIDEEEDATSSNMPRESVCTPPKSSSIQNINDFEGPHKRELKGLKMSYNDPLPALLSPPRT